MKTAIIVSLLVLSSAAHSAVLCQSVTDYNYRAWFPGYTCPMGYTFIRSK